MNQVSSLANSFFQNTLTIGKVKNLNLQPGQIVKGSILDLIDNRNALVMINNTKLLARLEIPLEKGQKSWFMVTSTGEEVKLKIMTEKNNPSKAVSTNYDLIKNLEIKNTTNNRMILSELVNRELPIGKQIVENINLALDKNMNLNNIIDIIKYLTNKDLPINLTNICSINEYFQNEDLFNKLENINKSIHLAIDKVNVVPEESKNLSEKINYQLNKVMGQSEEIVNEFKSINNNGQIDKVDSKQIMTNFTKITRLIDVLQQQFTNTSINSGDNISRNIEQLLENKSQLPLELVMDLEKVHNHLTGQNLAITSEQSIFSQITLQVPSMVPFSENPVFIQIHSKKKDEKQVDPDDMLLVFLFNLDNLGDLLVKMKIVQNDLVVQINNDNPDIKKIVKVLEPEFIDFLEENGYRTSGITVQSFEIGKEQNKASFDKNYKGVDIRL